MNEEIETKLVLSTAFPDIDRKDWRKWREILLEAYEYQIKFI